jgi:hypothetical protein
VVCIRHAARSYPRKNFFTRTETSFAKLLHSYALIAQKFREKNLRFLLLNFRAFLRTRPANKKATAQKERLLFFANFSLYLAHGALLSMQKLFTRTDTSFARFPLKKISASG